jgi:hypothetical protein
MKLFGLNFLLYSLSTIGCLANSTLIYAQDLEPRSYSNIPVGTNFAVVGTGYTAGAVLFDPTIPLENAKIKINGSILGYARSLKIGKMSGKFDAIVPYAWLSGSADYKGQPATRNVSGFGDMRLGLSVNFIGAPALPLAGFKDYKQKLVVGATVRVYLPLSQYDPDRLVNIGTNRIAIKQELGVSKKYGRLFLEASVGASIYTTNHDFFQGKTLKQDPIYFIQSHVIYTLKNGMWFALDGTYYWGGATTVDDVKGDNLQQNTRAGFTCAIPVNIHNSLKLNLSTGVSTRTGTDFNVVFLVWQYRWGKDIRKKKTE